MLNETNFLPLVPKDNVKKSKKEKSRTAPSSLFQRKHVDLLLEELIKKFPPQRVKVQKKKKMKREALKRRSLGLITPRVSCFACCSLNVFLMSYLRYVHSFR